MLTAVQYNILPSSFMFPVYVSTLDDITLSSLQSVLQTSGCGKAEVVIFVVDKYHCILLDGRVAFVILMIPAHKHPLDDPLQNTDLIDVLISFHRVLQIPQKYI
jgi:predicted metallopeptidase